LKKADVQIEQKSWYKYCYKQFFYLINKTIFIQKSLLWKERLNSDGQQFH
jgi:hypothetical protein